MKCNENNYYNKLLNTIDYYGLKVNSVKNKEFIMLSTLERECHRKGSNLDEFFYLTSISAEEYERFIDIFSMNQAERAMSLFEEKAGWKEKRYEE